MKMRNRLLAFLPKKDFVLLEPHLKAVRLTHGHPVIEIGQRFNRVIFIESGAVSYVSRMNDGTEVESLSIGREGAVGLVASVGPGAALRSASVQISGEGLAIGLKEMRAAFESSEAIRDMAMRYTTLQLSQVMQWVACNARHSVEARLARWLLTCVDRIDDGLLEFKHDYLADTLGVTRTSVTLAARSLQSAGLILYSRGKIRLVDIGGLKDASCECYGVFRKHIDYYLPADRKSGRASLVEERPIDAGPSR
jgi:CRP-like cAMP-binding protein